jgi:hypothetical protein
VRRAAAIEAALAGVFAHHAIDRVARSTHDSPVLLATPNRSGLRPNGFPMHRREPFDSSACRLMMQMTVFQGNAPDIRAGRQPRHLLADKPQLVDDR